MRGCRGGGTRGEGDGAAGDGQDERAERARGAESSE